MVFSSIRRMPRQPMAAGKHSQRPTDAGGPAGFMEAFQATCLGLSGLRGLLEGGGKRRVAAWRRGGGGGGTAGTGQVQLASQSFRSGTLTVT